MTKSSLKTSSMKELLKSFEEQIGRKINHEDITTVKLDNVDPMPLSGEFNLSVGTTKDLNNKINQANINKNDIAVGIENTSVNKKPKIGR